MATYITLVSLLQDLNQHLNLYHRTFGLSEQGFCPFTKEEIKSLLHAVASIEFFVRHRREELMKNPTIEKKIVGLIREAGNYVDYWAVECFPDLSLKRGIVRECSRLPEITREIVSIKQELKQVFRDAKVKIQEVRSSSGQSSTLLSPSRRTPNIEGKLVGLEMDSITMLDNLYGYTSKLKVLSIIGMGGIGKTTFARKLYDDPLVVHHFYVRAWVTVSHQYQLRDMLLGVLRCITIVPDEIQERSNEELREHVYKILKGKRYLIVLDDIWDTKGWDELKRLFPEDKNGSRIMLTTRIRDVAIHASQNAPPHCLRCLSIQESWELLSLKIFGDESCPLELVEIGKQIAFKCQGLPLALVVIGGLLSKMEKKIDVWDEVARRVGSLVIKEAEDYQEILALSFNHLPDHLKPCFLYMGVFPEDHEVSVKKLTWLWVAEGFIRPTALKSLEEVAEDHLEDLITRSLVLVKRRGPDGKIKTCYIHDLMRELCLIESQKLNFLQVINNYEQLPLKNLLDDLLLYVTGIRQAPQNYLHDLRRISFHSNIRRYIHKASFPYTRSIMCFERLSLSDSRTSLGMDLRLLKVLNIMNIHLREIPDDIMNLTQLNFVALTIRDPLDLRSLFMLCSLQTIFIDCEWDGHLPRTFWGMRKLRHFHLTRSYLSYSSSSESPSTSVLEPGDAESPLKVQKNLRSISTLRPISCTKRIFLSMPHLKKLGVYETEEDCKFRGWFKKLIHLQELESLKYVFSNPFVSSIFRPERLLSWENFPPKLMKLTLSGTSLPWDDMFILSMLPKLEVLKLRNFAFSGTIWRSEEGGFRCLKFLLIGSTNLEVWEADGAHFPKLEHLVLRHCRSLREIPYGIGETPLLENIELHCCKDSAVMSARQLQEEQQSFGNYGLTVRITEG